MLEVDTNLLNQLTKIIYKFMTAKNIKKSQQKTEKSDINY